MKLPTPTIQLKIALPFTLLFAATSLVVALVSISLISRTLDQRLQSQIEEVSAMISQAGFAMNPTILDNVKAVVGAEIVTCERNGRVITSTLRGETASELLAAVRSPDATEAIFAQGTPLVIRRVAVGGESYRIAYRPLQSPPDTLVALAFPTSDIEATAAAITRSIGVIAALAIAVMALISQLIARSITSPIKRLVDFTGSLAAGDLSRTAPVASRDEVGQLVRAFDEMVQRLRASEQELLHSEKLAVTGQLAARVAHDVRNPLSSIKMRAQLLRTRIGPEPADRESLEAILREIERVERVVEGLLDLSRPGELSLATGDVNDVLEEALRAIEPTLTHRKIAVERCPQRDLPAARFDADRLTNAVLNLIANAADAMPDGGSLVAATGSDEDGTSVYLEIRDRGAGIDPGIRDKLFDPFVTTRRDGVGLGLLNTRSIVERHGGRVELLPGDPRGTRARITLPRAGQKLVASPADG
jgi:signal transduction histidine kinase